MSARSWARLGGNMLAAFLIGEGVMVLLRPTRQSVLWSPRWSPTPWRRPLRLLAGRPRLTRALASLEIIAGLALAIVTDERPHDR